MPRGNPPCDVFFGGIQGLRRDRATHAAERDRAHKRDNNWIAQNGCRRLGPAGPSAALRADRQVASTVPRAATRGRLSPARVGRPPPRANEYWVRNRWKGCARGTTHADRVRATTDAGNPRPVPLPP